MTRGITVLFAVLLAALAAAATFAYLQDANKQTTTSSPSGAAGTETVVVATQNVPVGADLGALADSAFATRQISKDDVVPGAITNVSQLDGHRSSIAILKGEQVPAQRLKGVSRQPGGVLGIPDGYEATSADVEPQRIVGGVPTAGDKVAVWAVVSDSSGGSRLEQISSAAQILRIGPSAAAANQSSGSATTQSGTGYRVTMALTQSEVERFILDHDVGKIYMSLLGPGAKPQRAHPLTTEQGGKR